MIDFIIEFDITVATFLATHQDLFLYQAFSFITILGDWWFVLILLLVLFWVLEERGKYWRAGALLFGFVGTQVSVFFLKYLVGRERPSEQVYSFLKGFSDTPSFPSGHSATAVAFYGLLLYFMLSREPGQKMRAGLFSSGVFLILMIGFSRLYLGVHYLSDVLAGFIIGGVFLFLSISIAGRRVPCFIKEFLKKYFPKLWKCMKNSQSAFIKK